MPEIAVARAAPGLLIDGEGALLLEEHGTLVVADIHWGYSRSHRARGNLLPMHGDDEIAARLEGLIARHRPCRMIWLGDTLHTLAGRSQASAWMDAHPDLEIIPVSGNHDRRWERARTGALRIGRFLLHHGDGVIARGADEIEIMGHWHPAVSHRDGAGTSFKVPALVHGPHRIILPAFSPWASGVPWNERIETGETLWLVTPRRVFALRK
jgi:putative SbcD/Mre11-related phosphoesterase